MTTEKKTDRTDPRNELTKMVELGAKARAKFIAKQDEANGAKVLEIINGLKALSGEVK